MRPFKYRYFALLDFSLYCFTRLHRYLAWWCINIQVVHRPAAPKDLLGRIIPEPSSEQDVIGIYFMFAEYADKDTPYRDLWQAAAKALKSGRIMFKTLPDKACADRQVQGILMGRGINFPET